MTGALPLVLAMSEEPHALMPSNSHTKAQPRNSCRKEVPGRADFGTRASVLLSCKKPYYLWRVNEAVQDVPALDIPWGFYLPSYLWFTPNKADSSQFTHARLCL